MCRATGVSGTEYTFEWDRAWRRVGQPWRDGVEAAVRDILVGCGMRSEAIVYGTDQPALMRGRTLHITSGPSYDSVRAYGLWLPGHPLLVTVTGLATGNPVIVWESPWHEHTTSAWRDTVVESAIRVRHHHRHGGEPVPGNGSVGAERGQVRTCPHQITRHANPNPGVVDRSGVAV
ncbi:hypothetical protein ACFQ3B_17750 [Stackebrandtia endophytica]|nr:hypothetical protein [Stackebrandtia endophytica]